MSDTRARKLWLTAGIIFSSLLMLPYIILGKDSIIPYHDQLDGELMGYILHAKYLFTGTDVYPELMNGLPATGVLPPAPLFVLLYRWFSPFVAFLASQWIVYVVGFVGMYLLLDHLTGKTFYAFAIGMIFTLFSFYPVYGLCIPGQPLLLWAALKMVKKEQALRKAAAAAPASRAYGKAVALAGISLMFPYILLIIFYGLCSSLVLVGFAVLLVLLLWAVGTVIHAVRTRASSPLTPWLSLLVLTLTYLLSNLSLVEQILFGSYVSHKTEVVYYAQDFLSAFSEVFTQGISYAQGHQKFIFPMIAICLFVLMVRASRTAYGKRFLAVLAFIFVTCALYALYLGEAVTELRNSSDGVLKSFNLMRIVWLLPTAWCLLAGYGAAYLTSRAEGDPALAPRTGTRVRKAFSSAFLLVTFAVWGVAVLYDSPLKSNVAKLVKDDYYAMTWEQFFAEDIFTEIEETIGEPQDSYRVVSLGIYPAAAAYNGFYCLDAYSNNYPVSYKHEFREIMTAELEKSDYARAYYDGWGNRCYLMSAQYTNYFTFEKKWGATFDDLELNIDKLREMGCDYIFSAGYITNADDMGLTLLRDEPFETDGSWYRIYVYVVIPS